MREIKFRALGISGWLYFTLEQLIDGSAEFYRNHNLKYWSQFTGLKDKNGKEVYEGDIVKDCSQHWDDYNTNLHDCTGFVKYLSHIDMAEFQSVNDTDGIKVKNDCYEGWFPLSNKVEVIGNIYENGDLLI